MSGLFNQNSKYCLIRDNSPKTKIISKEQVEKAKKIIMKYEKQRQNSKLKGLN